MKRSCVLGALVLVAMALPGAAVTVPGTVVGKSVVYQHKKADGTVSLAPLIEPSTGSYGMSVQISSLASGRSFFF